MIVQTIKKIIESEIRKNKKRNPKKVIHTKKSTPDKQEVIDKPLSH